MADDTFYDGFKEKMPEGGMNFLNGKKEISDEEIEIIREQVSELVKKANKERSSPDEVKRELEFIF